MDLDPGQPEFGPSGILSLVMLQQPILGPPFAHQLNDFPAGNRVLHAHSIMATSPKEDPEYFLSCFVDLVDRLPEAFGTFSKAPLIVNCCGWTTGVGLRLLIKIISHLVKIDKLHVIHMGDAPVEIHALARDSPGDSEVKLHELSARPSNPLARSAVELRTMQFLSYFHQEVSINGSPKWNGLPLTYKPPWIVSYGTINPGILGILQIGDEQPAKMLATILNGTVVAVVLVDDYCTRPASETERNGRHDSDDEMEDMQPDYETLETNGMVRSPDDPVPRTGSRDATRGNGNGAPPVSRTTHENLPYLDHIYLTGDGQLASPRFSRTLGLALVRGIDVENQSLHLLTPIPKQTILDIQSETAEGHPRIILVLGSLDAPGWAYQEDLQLAALSESRRKRDQSQTLDEDIFREELSDGHGEVPWVKPLNSGELPGSHGRKRRLRRF